MEFLTVLVIILIVLVLLFGYATMHLLNRIDQRLRVMGATIATIQRSTSTTQSELRTRLKDGTGVRPIVEKPKADQHYEGRGARRVARGGKTDDAGGEGTPARIGQVARRSYGGSSSNPPGS